MNSDTKVTDRHPTDSVRNSIDLHTVPTNTVGDTKQPKQSRGWDLTWNTKYFPTDPTDPEAAAFITQANIEIPKLLNKHFEEWAYQWEVGAKEGRLHLQGWAYGVLRTKDTLDNLLTLGDFEDEHGIGIACAPARKLIALKQYIAKEKTRFAAGASSSSTNYILNDPMAGLELYPWQQTIKNLLAHPPDPREIFWFWDTAGCAGKTTFAKHLCMQNESTLYVAGKSADVKCMIHTLIIEKKIHPTVIIFDFVRSVEEYVSYDAIESVKNGIFFSGKYHPGMVMFNPPHVIILANFEPQRNKLSQDRWKIEEITRP